MKKFSELIKGQDCLFRYRAYKEETLNALEKNRIYFSRPSYFNDPYENNGCIRYPKTVVEDRHKAQHMQAVGVVRKTVIQ